MLDKKIVKQSLTFAGLAVLYVALVATVLLSMERVSGPDKKTILVPMAILLLLVVSAATMGTLVFGKPVMLYIDGKKREAVTMVICTIASLALITALLFVAVVLLR